MNQRTLFTGGTIYTVGGLWQEAWLLVADGKIAGLGQGQPPDATDAQVIDLSGCALIPGLIDLHVHGALGRDAMEPDPQALVEMSRYYAQHGVTSFLASTITASREAITRALANIGAVMRQDTGGAQLLGTHLEGPFIEAERRGAHDIAQIRVASFNEYEAYLRTGVIKLLTVAPEYPENLALITATVEHGITVALGHSRATYEQVCQAVALGARQVTHLFNGMEPLHHRLPGVVGAALTQPALCCELIADLVHVAAPVLQLAWRAKSTDGIVLVTDAMSGTGMPDGAYLLGGETVNVLDGTARIASGALAGSTLTLERGLSNMMQACQLSLAEALPMATANPARQLGLASKGRIAFGCDADLVVLAEGKVMLTMVQGHTVYKVI
ncbi:MAG: N-acetylglucosamine-6-phosphate deacetylase [Anaerolineae bacterium]